MSAGRFRILDDSPAPAPRPAVAVRQWYDRHARTWVVQRVDADGGQVGDAEFAGTRAGADAIARQLRDELGDGAQ